MKSINRVVVWAWMISMVTQVIAQSPPVSAPIKAPVSAPVTAPVKAPVAAPVVAPIVAPVVAPVKPSPPLIHRNKCKKIGKYIPCAGGRKTLVFKIFFKRGQGDVCRQKCVKRPHDFLTFGWKCGRCFGRPTKAPVPTSAPFQRFTNICKQREQYVPCGDGLGTVVWKKKLFSKKCIEKCFKKPYYPVVFRRFKCGYCP